MPITPKLIRSLRATFRSCPTAFAGKAPAREAAAAIETHAAYIKGETLATDLTSGDPTSESHSDEVKLGKDRVRIGLTRAGSLLDSR